MKTKILFIAMLVATMAFQSCSKGTNPKDFAGEYVGETIQVTNGEMPVANAKAVVTKVSNSQVEISLRNSVNGFADYVFTADLTVENEKATFSHAFANGNMKYDIQGNIFNKKATISVKTTVEAPNLLKTWTYATENQSLDAVDIEYANGSGKVMWQGKEITNAEFASNMKQWTQLILGMVVTDLRLTFKANGYVDVYFVNGMEKDPAKKVVEVQNLARFSYDEAKQSLNFDAPIALPEAGVATTFLVPFQCKFVDGKLSAHVPFNVIKPLLPMIPTGEKLNGLIAMAESMIPAGMEFIKPVVKTLITDVVNALTDKSLTNLAITAKMQEYRVIE